MMFDDPKQAPRAAPRLAVPPVTNAPPGHLSTAPRSRAHGEMCAMLRDIHRFPPLIATVKHLGVQPLDQRILTSVGLSGFARFDLLQFPAVRDRAKTAHAAYLNTVNL